MTVIELPFTVQEIQEEGVVHAIIEVVRPSERPGPFSPPQWAGSYGAVIWGSGLMIKIWGAGYAKSDDILRASAVKRILEMVEQRVTLTIHCKGLEQQLRYVSASDGLTADGKARFVGFSVLKKIQNARERGEWKLALYKKRQEPRGYRLAKHEAKKALACANSLNPFFSRFAEDCPDSKIIATNDNPNPDGLLNVYGGE